MHVEFLLEEESAKAALDILLQRLFPPDGPHTFQTRVLRGKHTLLKELPRRLKGYADQLKGRPGLRVVVLLDRDNDDCVRLKEILEQHARAAGLNTKTHPAADGAFHVVTRIACEELEAWFLGDPAAISSAYPRVRPPHFKTAFAKATNPDAIPGGTAEALERVFKEANCWNGRLKYQWAETIAPHLDPGRNTSASFQAFWQGVQTLLTT